MQKTKAPNPARDTKPRLDARRSSGNGLLDRHAVAQRELRKTIDESPEVEHLTQLQALADNASNRLPRSLSHGIAHLSGLDLSDVQVTYNSSKPAQLDAHAYAQGRDIFVGPGQEAHLPHEAWHVVQQRQGRVQPTGRVGGVSINDDAALEREADVMGTRAMQSSATGAASPGRTTEAHTNAPVQRYIKPLADDSQYRVSDNRNIVTLGPQWLYATREKITEAALALATAKSLVTVAEDPSPGRTPWEPFEGGTRTKTVYPVMLAWVPEAVPGGSVHERLSHENRFNILYYSWADCHRTAQTVMGSSSKTGDNKEQPLVNQDGVYKPLTPISSEHSGAVYLSDAQANRGIYALFEHAFPKFVTVLTEAGLADAHRELIARIGEIARERLSKGKINRWWVTYKNHILTNPALADLFAKTFKINDYAAPSIGDSLSQVSNETERHAETNKAQKLALKYELPEDSSTEALRTSGRIPPLELATLRDLWNFHWAGVIMKDGSDYVTLENLSVENINLVNRNWYFRMYGVGAQSFHTEAGRDPHSGDTPITSGFRHVPEM